MLVSPFAFVTCQPGAERALKRELAQRAPRWMAAYQRPGLLTFKSPEPISPELTLETVFARQYGMSLGSFPDLAAVASALRALPAPLCLHVIEREPLDADAPASERVRELDAELRAALPHHLTSGPLARDGELVATVVAGQADPFFVGCHRQRAGRSPWPGARLELTLPEHAPSRAYLKLEEAVRTFSLPLRAGDTALELGAAPGGAAYALLQRGIRVFAVDPAAMDPRLLQRAGSSGARVVHLPLAMRELRREQLPGRVDWLLLDVHLAPQIALRAARHWASELRSTLCGAVLTLKLNDWSFAERVDSFLAQSREMGLVDPRAKQLGSHRQEIAIVGLTKRGAARIDRGENAG